MSQDIYVVIEHLRGKVTDISYMLIAAAKALAQGTGGDVIAVLLAHNGQELSRDLAVDHVLYLDHPTLAGFNSDAYQMALSGLLEHNSPRVMLLGNTSIGSDVASVLSTRLGLPLVSLCHSFNEDGLFVSQICGGKIMAEGIVPGPVALITMIPGSFDPEDGKSSDPPEVTPFPVSELDDSRLRLIGYIEPEPGDVDISNESILIAVGRGIQTQDNIELAEELAELMEGTVAASRPVVDQGWLPTSRMVGKSGLKVKPKLYMALGISGAPEHVEGIVDAEMIVAVNTDPAAPIFDVARYGTDVDVLDLLDELIEQIEDA